MARVSTQSQSYVELCQRSSVGKRLPDALYVHRSALGYLDAALQELEQLARKVTAQVEKATIIKVQLQQAANRLPVFIPTLRRKPIRPYKAAFKSISTVSRPASETTAPPIILQSCTVRKRLSL